MPNKIIVAVHGIGEQLRGETIRAVATQVCRFWNVPASMPLGRVGAELIPGPGGQPYGSFVVTTPPDPNLKEAMRRQGGLPGDAATPYGGPRGGQEAPAPQGRRGRETTWRQALSGQAKA